MGTKTKSRGDCRLREDQRSAGTVGRVMIGASCLALIIGFSPDKIRAIGTFLLCLAMTLRVLVTAFLGRTQCPQCRGGKKTRLSQTSVR